MPRRVLLVDDDIAEISAVKRVLLREGAQAHLATNTTDALAALAAAPPELLLIAPTCENGEGLQLARRLAAGEATRHLPLILLGAPEEEAPGTPMKRPIDPGLLAEAVRRHLQPADRGTAVQASPRAAAPSPPAPAATFAPPSPPASSAESPRPAPASGAASTPTPAPAAEARRQAAEALRARAEELRRAGSEERARREQEARRRREEEIELEERGRIEAAEEARTRAEEDARRALATSEAEEALRQLAAEVEETAPAAPLPAAAVPAPSTARATERGPAAESSTAPVPSTAPPPGRAEPERAPPGEEAPPPRFELEPPAEALPPLELEPAPPVSEPAPEPSLPPPPPPALPAPAAAPPAPAPAVRPAPRFTPAPVRASAPSVAAAVAAREEAKRRASAARARKAPEPPAPEPPPPPRAGTAAPAPMPAAPPPEPEPEGPPVPMELSAGSLDRLSAAWLLARAARARLGGRLDFAGSAPRSLYWEEGRIVGATSGAPAERVEEVALRLGLITREQHRQAAPACAGLPSRRAAMALLDAGFLKPEELTGLVRRRTEEVVFALFAEPGATWRHAHARVPADERTALDRGAPALAVEGVRRRWGAERLDRLLGGPATLLAPALGGPPREELGLGREERRLLELADGLRSVDEIASDSPLDPLSARQVLGALVEVGTLSVRIRGEPVAARPSSAIDLARLAEKLDQVRRADYFTILGVSRAATPYELRASAERLLQELDAPRWALIDEPGLGERIAEVRRVVAEARDVLLDPELRASYVEGLE